MTPKTKRILKITIPSVWLIAFIGSVIYNSAAEPENRIPFIPVVDISINGKELPVLNVVGTLTGTEIKKELYALGVPAHVPFILADRDFAIVEHDDMEEMVRWMNRFYWSTPLLRYRAEAYDCDNFARTFSTLADFAAIPIQTEKSITAGQLSIIRIYTKQEYAFGGVPAGGYHALTIYRTTRGWFAYEPQSGERAPLKQYKNLKHIINLNGD